MKKLTFKFSQSEFRALYGILQNTIAEYNYNDGTPLSGINGKIHFCNLFRVCKRIHLKLFNKQERYTFSVAMDEALSFHAFYSNYLILDTFCHILVTRMCAEIHKMYLV